MASESEESIRIPPEIITDILYRLPAKSLGRFKCVSKDWLSLISKPQFIKIHQKTLNRNHLIFTSNCLLYSLPFHQHKAVLRPMKLRLELPDVGMLTFHGFCNGLVLLSAYDSNYDHKLVVLNPTTRALVELSVSGNEIIDNLIETDIMFGFGYDSMSDDYKVVTISRFCNDRIRPPDYMSVHVHSLRTNTWRQVIDSPYYHPYNLPGVFVNGFLYWVAHDGNTPIIVAFSLADETFIEVPSPNLCNDVDIKSMYNCTLLVLGEKLAIFLDSEVCLMNEYGVWGSWTKILARGLDEMPIVEPMIFYDNGKLLLVSNNQMLIYDEEKSFCKKIDTSEDLMGLIVRGAYVESLVSPKFS